MPYIPPIMLAVTIAGSRKRLAQLVGVTPNSVTHWIKSGRIPAERCASVAGATGIPKWILRPDLWSPEEDEDLAECNVPPLPRAEIIIDEVV
jgi:DNA-binding transcriptional regulator YdaS (Cro superfamily)